MLIKIADRRKGLALRHPQVVATAAAPPLPRPLVAVPRIESRGRRLLLVSGSSSTKGCERSHLESAQPPPPHQHSLTFAATTSSFTSRGSGGRALKPRPTREAAAATRAAFATADIRRALARLAQQQQQPAMRHFELDCKGASGQEQAEEKSFSSRRDEHDDERAAQVAAGAQWTAATSCLGGSGKLEEISTSAPVISDIHERHRASAQQARSSCSTGEGATTTKTRRRRTKNIQISSEEESYADLGGTSSRVAQQSRASAYANSERDQPPAEQQQVSSALCNQNEAISSNLQSEHHQQQEVMSTQSSFVSGSVSDQLAQQQFNHHHQQQQQDRPLISAHPIGLGCFGAGQQQMEPVPGASDNSIVMTSSGAHSPDDEHETFSPRERAPGGEQRAHQLRHSLGGAQLSSLAAAAAGGDSSQLSLNGAGNAGPGKSFLGKLVGKKASRFRELVLQNLGKADRTQDELFDLYEVNFYKQQQQVARLTKEFKLYSTALKSYHEASKSLNKCIQQATTDYQSARHDLVCENLTHLEQLNEDLMEKLQEQVMRSVGEYLSKFEETKEKISKRHRKLIDYDSSRRLYELMLANVTKKRSRQQLQCELSESQQQQHPQNYQSILRGLKFLSQQQQQQQQPQQLQESIASQLVDEARLLKLREQFNYCKLMYENINSELHVELPIVYEKKMKSLLQALQNYYAIKAHYHSNAGKLLSVVSEVIEECPQSINAVLGIARKDSKRRSESSSSTNYDDDDDDSDDVEYGHEPNADKARSLQQQQHITGGGSSGVGSSRGDSVVDSASSPSSSSSPDCAAVVADSDRNSPSGKAHGPADLTRAEQQFAPECSQSVGELAASADGSPDGAEPVESVDEDTSGEQVVATGDDETVVTPQKVQPEVTEQPEAPSRQVDNDKEQPESNPKEEDNEEVKIKILNTTRPSSAKCEELQVEDEQDSAGAVQGVEERPLLYKVKTNYKYLAEDVDELCFEADEIIQVIEFDENHEPEDGWLLGIREVNNQRGLFPANFTQPI